MRPLCCQATPVATDALDDPRVEPVVLLKGRPGARFQLLGAVEAKGPNKRRAESGLTIRGAMMGADAVVDLNAERLSGFVRTEHRACGTAVRAVDEEGRLELKSRWFDTQLRRISFPMVIMAVLFGRTTEYIRASVNSGVSRAPSDALLENQLGTAASLAFWIVIAGLTLTMFIRRWPQLVRPVSICFLAKAIQEGLAVLGRIVTIVSLASSLVMETTVSFDDQILSPVVASTIMVSSTALSTLWSLSFLFFFLYLGRRAWRIDQEFRTMATASTPATTTAPWKRRSIGTLAWFLAVVSSVCLIGAQTVKATRTVAGAIFGGRDPADDRLGLITETMNDAAWRAWSRIPTPRLIQDPRRSAP